MSPFNIFEEEPTPVYALVDGEPIPGNIGEQDKKSPLNQHLARKAKENSKNSRRVRLFVE